jgi:aryl-alcohol dehydrogenase
MRSLKVGDGQSLAVFGTGSVGLSAIMGARIVGADPIIAIDVNPARLAAARDLGATHTIDASREDVAARLREITGHGVKFAIDTSGLARSVKTAVESLAPLGTCGVIAATREPEVGIVTRQLMVGGRSIRGIAEGDSIPDEFIPELVEHHARGRLPLERLVTHFPFERINEAIHEAHTGAVIKPILRMGNR